MPDYMNGHNLDQMPQAMKRVVEIVDDFHHPGGVIIVKEGQRTEVINRGSVAIPVSCLARAHLFGWKEIQPYPHDAARGLIRVSR